jgi:DNA ligase-1
MISQLDIDPRGMLASAKLDGIHGIFDGGKLRTRNGKILAAPEWFINGLPDCRIHGEIWLGNRTFPTLAGRVQRRGDDWRGIQFQIFDCALEGGFADRMATISRLSLPDHVCVIPQREIRHEHEVDEMEAAIVSNGGEGVMLRHPLSDYRPCKHVHKVKRLFPDLNRAID